MNHLVTESAYGGMPHEESEISMRLFAEPVMPILQRDAVFDGHTTAAAAPVVAKQGSEGVFASP